MSRTLRTLLTATTLAGAVALSSCGSDDDTAATNDEPDLTSAPEATWTTSAGVPYPRGTAGKCPEKTDPVPHGYAQTPQCAVIAAMSGQVMLATTGDKDYPEMSRTILAEGPGKQQWDQARALQTVSGQENNPATFAGFTFTDYSDERAQLLLAVEWPDGTLTAQPTQLAWQGGDWRLVLPTQQNAVDATEIENLDAFTTFGPDESRK